MKRKDSALEKAALTLGRAHKFWDGYCLPDECSCYMCKKARAFLKACAAHRKGKK